MEFLAPKTRQEALEMLENLKSEARILAGGTDLTLLIRRGLIDCKHLINITKLTELCRIEEQNKEISIGALTTHTMVIGSSLLLKKAPHLVEACKSIASPQIRNKGTVGGNLINASPAADLAPPLLVLDARLEVQKLGSSREIEINKLFVAPGKPSIEPDELVTSIHFNPLSKMEGAAYFKLGKRKSNALSVCCVAVYVKLDTEGRYIQNARIALGAVAPTPVRAYKTEKVLKNAAIEDCLSRIGNLVQSDINPIDDIRSTRDYRLKTSAILAERAIIKAIKQARNNNNGEA